jgi:AcrR family transcriptional regulator
MVKNASRKEREKQRHSEEILLAAEKVFAEKGFTKTKMSDIADVSEFSVGYLYNLWKSKNELYLDVVTSKIEAYILSLDELVRRAEGPLEKLNILIDTHFHFFEVHRDFFRIYLSEISQAEAHCQSVFNVNLRKKREMFYQYAEQALREGVEQGIFKAHSPRDLAIALKGIMFSFSIESLNLSTSEELNEKKNVVKQLFFDSILKVPESAGKELRTT